VRNGDGEHVEPTFSITTDLAGQKADVEAVLAAFEAAGFTAAHWCHDWTGEPVLYDEAFAARVRGLAEAHALRIADVHGFSGTGGTGIPWTVELFERVNVNRARFAARVGADVLVLHLPALPTPDVDEAARRAVADVRRILDSCRELGVRLAVENLAGPAHVPAFFDALFERFAPDELGFCYDSGHALLTGRQDLVVRYAGRLAATHLHDNDGTGDQHRLPSEGRCDWPMILGAIKQSAYTGTINLEVRLPRDADLHAFCRKAHRRIAELWAQAPPRQGG
jgi:sugar phosphate isomerase/epimerase